MIRGANRDELSRFVPSALRSWDATVGGQSFQLIDGTLCFADISGFTNLSERLAQLGRIGAEELVVVLNRVFGDMLDIAYRRGGQLLKYGGDALFLLFEGEDHPRQAASAAVEMRASLRSSSQIPTSVGRVPLKMSTGLHSGEIHAFRVGKLHHELVVSGPASTMVTAMETAARPGEIMISAGTRSRLPANSTSEGRDDGSLLRWRKPRCEYLTDVPSPPSPLAITEPCLDPDLTELLGSGHSESEHRVANLAFLQFRGVDERLRVDGPATVAELINNVVTTVQQHCIDESVTFLATDVAGDGGKMILTSGAPIGREDDAGRILRMIRGVLDTPTELDVRVGVNQGHVFLGEVGTNYRSTFTVVGDAVNLAARLMAAAPSGRCYASPVLVSQSRSQFKSTPVPPFFVKGKTEPVRALELGEEGALRMQTLDHQLDLVGRSVELKRLTETIRANLRGEADVATLIAERGFGKSRLIAEALTEVGSRSFTIHADPYAMSSPYRAFRDTARRLLGVTRSDHPTMERALLDSVAAIAPDLLPLAPLLGDIAHVQMASTPETERIDPQFRSARLAGIVVELMSRTLTEPTLLIVEDAHWMDDASQSVLRRIEQKTASRPWAMVVTRRPEPGGYEAKNAIQIELNRLRPPEVRNAINRATEATPLRPHDVTDLVERIDGNPLFLQEIVRSIQTAGGLIRLPDSLESVLAQRVDQLSPLARRVLRSAAVLGLSFRTEVLRLTLGNDVALDASTQAVLDEFIEPDGERFAFRHAMLRDSLYESLPFRRRRELHRRAAEAIATLAGDGTASVAHVLGLHSYEAGDYSSAWVYSKMAGDQAKARYGNVEAAVHYRRAMEASRFTTDDTDVDRYEVLMSLGEVCMLAGQNEDALAACSRAAKLTANPVDKARAHQARAKCAGRTGAFTSAFRQISAGRRALAKADNLEAVKANAALSALSSTLRIGQQRPRDADRDAQRAIDEAEIAGDQTAMAQARQVRGIAAILTTGLDEQGHLTAASELYRELGDLPGLASVTNTLGAEAFYASDWPRAVSFYEESQAAYVQIGDDAGAALAGANVGEILVLRRRHEEAVPILAEASRTLRACGEREQLPFVDTQQGRALLGMGRSSDALLVFDRTADAANELGQATSRVEATLLSCLALLDLGLADTAALRFHESEELFKGVALEVLHSIVEIRIALGLGKREAAVAAAHNAIPLVTDGVEPGGLDLVALMSGHGLVPDELIRPIAVEARRLQRSLGISTDRPPGTPLGSR